MHKIPFGLLASFDVFFKRNFIVSCMTDIEIMWRKNLLIYSIYCLERLYFF